MEVRTCVGVQATTWRRMRLVASLVFALPFFVSVVARAEAPVAHTEPPRFDALSYSPSHLTEFEDLKHEVTTAHLRADLAQLAPITRAVRTYGVSHGLDKVPVIAARYGLKVDLGVWLGPDPKANTAEIAHAIAVVRAHPNVISRVVVGNECIGIQKMNVNALIAAIKTVRRGIGGKIPVGTADIWSVWLREPKLVAASDFIGAHIIPYWDGVAADQAAPYVLARAAELQKAFPGKPLFIAETGWPTSGLPRGAAVPSLENRTRFVAQFRALDRGKHLPYVMLEAYDQPWKAETTLWGFFDVHGAPKASTD